jgi:branched-subunit amino acid aminotransferase/4-amino-4-deoxychorismate lyase
MLAVDGAILPHLDAHLDRMAAGCAILGLPALDRRGRPAPCAWPRRRRPWLGAAPPCA